MRNLLFAIFLMAFINMGAQLKYDEPEFINDVVAIMPDSTTMNLFGQIVPMTTKTKTSSDGIGIGGPMFGGLGIVGSSSWSNSKSSLFLTIPGKMSETRFPVSTQYSFIIRSERNDINPQSFIKLVKLKVKGDSREIDFTSNNDKQKYNVPFTAKRYGEHSYLLSTQALFPGEYAFVIFSQNGSQDALFLTEFAVQTNKKSEAEIYDEVYDMANYESRMEVTPLSSGVSITGVGAGEEIMIYDRKGKMVKKAISNGKDTKIILKMGKKYLIVHKDKQIGVQL